jgi:hypothetical protein
MSKRGIFTEIPHIEAREFYRLVPEVSRDGIEGEVREEQERGTA